MNFQILRGMRSNSYRESDKSRLRCRIARCVHVIQFVERLYSAGCRAYFYELFFIESRLRRNSKISNDNRLVTGISELIKPRPFKMFVRHLRLNGMEGSLKLQTIPYLQC